MSSTRSNSARRMFARVVVAGAIAVVPLAAVTVPALADTPAGPDVTEVNRPHWDGRDDWSNPWDRNNPWDQDSWRNRHDRWDDRRDQSDWQRDQLRWLLRNWVPRGSLGSS